MNLICPKCQYKGLVDICADEGVTCARCGTRMDQLLWTDSRLPLLTTTTAAATAVVDQRIMKNQNAYAPSAESVGDDVLEIPRPLQATQHAGEQMLVLDDVIPVPPAHDELSTWEDEFAPAMLAADEDDALSPEDDERESLALSASGIAGSGPQARSEILGAPPVSSVDYEGYRAWVRIAPLLLLVGALVFFTLYYLGNRMGGGDRAQNAATNPAPPDTSAIPATAPENVETATQPSQPAESSVVGAKAESPAPDEKLKVETSTPHEAPPATREEPPPATASAPVTAAPVAAPVVAPSVAPAAPVVASQGSGNYTIQVGSYNNLAQAEERVARLGSSGVEARVVRAEIPRRGTWYRVQAGRFSSQEEAARYGAQLKGKGATDDYIITGAQSQ